MTTTKIIHKHAKFEYTDNYVDVTMTVEENGKTSLEAYIRDKQTYATIIIPAKQMEEFIYAVWSMMERYKYP